MTCKNLKLRIKFITLHFLCVHFSAILPDTLVTTTTAVLNSHSHHHTEHFQKNANNYLSLQVFLCERKCLMRIECPFWIPGNLPSPCKRPLHLLLTLAPSPLSHFYGISVIYEPVWGVAWRGGRQRQFVYLHIRVISP